MSSLPSLDDTADMRLDGDDFAIAPGAALDDTDQFRIAANVTRLPVNARGRPYAEGIIGFYRARAILDADQDGTSWTRAWEHIENLAPHDVPGTARESFFELAYFMQEQSSRVLFNTIGFCARVRKIAENIDRFVDDQQSASRDSER